MIKGNAKGGRGEKEKGDQSAPPATEEGSQQFGQQGFLWAQNGEWRVAPERGLRIGDYLILRRARVFGEEDKDWRPLGGRPMRRRRKKADRHRGKTMQGG